MRNEPCPCNSGLKYKHCHGDQAKVQAVQQFAARLMLNLIQDERMRKGIIPFPFICNGCGKGFKKPKKSTISPGMPMCPECNNTDISKTKSKMEEQGGEG